MSTPSRSPRPTPVSRPLVDIAPDSGAVTLRGDAATAVTGITLDSRDVRPGDIFAALRGENSHGRDFIPQARAQGAVAVLTDPSGATEIGDLPALICADPRGVLGEVSAAVYGNPGRDLTLIGVTGTNGKTTVTHLIADGLRATGHRIGLIGTTGIMVHDEEIPAIRTTPEAPDMHALLAIMRERGISDVVMEVSSHALVQGRVDGLRFDVTGFTNLSPDHLDFHGNMESYFRAKSMLFDERRSRQGVICIDDEWGIRLADDIGIPHTTVSMFTESNADVTCINCRSDSQGRQFLRLEFRGAEHSVEVPMPGIFNATNAAVAWSILHYLGVTDRVIQAGFAEASIDGRMELIDAGQDFVVIVDYAHSPDAVERVIRSVPQQGRRIVVLGCGGDRDRHKRPEMGRIAAEFGDLVFITDDNPRSEDPASIRSAMVSGIDSQHRSRVREIADRRAAIAAAVEAAKSGDVVLILGKGHETGQEVAGVVHPFDDRDVARALLEEVVS